MALDERVRSLQGDTDPAECDGIAVEARRLANQALGPREQLKLENLARRMLLRAERFAGLRHFRVGLIGNRTLLYLIAPLRAAGLARGLLVEGIEVPCGSAAGLAFGPLSGLEPRGLDAAAIVLDEAAFIGSDAVFDDAGEAQALADAEIFLRKLVRAVTDGMGAAAIVATIPSTGPEISSSGPALAGSASRFRMLLNRSIVDGAHRREWMMWDLEGLAARVGRDDWFDAVRFHEVKAPFRIERGALVADHLCRTIAAMTGKSCRALVLDLDNTLWGGVVGDDGVQGIRLGHNSAEGEAYVDFQRFVLNLRRRGIVLAVCSKNTDAIAREPFRTHPEMLLKEEHIAVFQANWLDKAGNLAAIAEALDLGLESLGFADDDAAERERVRQELPLVSVPEIGSEPAYYAVRIADSGIFDHLLLTADDRGRAETYQRRTAGAELKARIGEYDDYLSSLKMTLGVSRFDAIGRARIAQLINKSNQFNLTTRRYSEIDIRRFEESTREILCWQASLEDLFGRHGIVAVVIVRTAPRMWTIDTWLMSCRVLSRGVEETLMNLLMAEARAAGVETVAGEYLPTPRNALVADFYPRLGFSPAENATPSPGACYRAHPASHVRLKSFIEIKRL